MMVNHNRIKFKLFYLFLLAEIHQFVPSDLRHLILKSSSSYTINDLLNLTNISETFEELKLNSSKNSIHLITQWYHETDLRRRKELISVLHMNVINNAITNIHLIQNSKNCTIFNDIEIDEQFPIDLLKMKLIIFYNENIDFENQRLIINQAFEYANHFIKTGYTILLNLDIFFDQSLLILKHRSLLDKNIILYLSRFEIDPSISTLGLQCSDYYVGSHDALIFRTPLPINLIKQFPFEIGTWHIEVKIIYEFLQENYIVRNTCKSIRTWHLHSSQIRHRLMPSEKYIPDKLLNQVLRYPEFL